MSQLDWTDVLNIGLPIIDKQHKELISLSNGLIQAMVNGRGTDVLEELFTQLREYTCYHFAEEEQYMEKIGYPYIDNQKATHKRLTNEVDEFRTRLLSNEGVSPNEALDFINGWIIQHIMEEDSQIGMHVNAG